MCIITFHIQQHPVYKMILAANRDERYDRPATPIHFWEDAPHILAGRDLEAMGTWMGITKQGKFAALTNYRSPMEKTGAAAESRGDIVASFLKGNDSAESFLHHLQANRQLYHGFNLLIGTVDRLLFYNQKENKIIPVEPGTHSISNASLNTPWPKVEKARTRLRDYAKSTNFIEIDVLFKQLHDTTPAETDKLPNTGVDPDLEKVLSSIFIRTDGYGTRNSSVLLVSHSNKVTFLEQTFEKGYIAEPFVHKQFQID